MAAIIGLEVAGAEAAGAETAEASEAGSAKSAFKADSSENASAKGVDLQGLGKLAGETLTLVMTILNFVRSEKRGRDEEQERKDNRHRAGIVFDPEESRLTLVRNGQIPAYYSSSNIRSLLADNKLPYGWSEETSINQGFGPEIRAGEFRRRNKDQIDNINKYYDDRLALTKQLVSIDSLDKRLRLNRALQQLNI
jgi:hypothetical protein